MDGQYLTSSEHKVGIFDSLEIQVASGYRLQQKRLDEHGTLGRRNAGS